MNTVISLRSYTISMLRSKAVGERGNETWTKSTGDVAATPQSRLPPSELGFIEAIIESLSH